MKQVTASLFEPVRGCGVSQASAQGPGAPLRQCRVEVMRVALPVGKAVVDLGRNPLLADVNWSLGRQEEKLHLFVISLPAEEQRESGFPTCSRRCRCDVPRFTLCQGFGLEQSR